MLFLEDIRIELKWQGYEAKEINFSPDGTSAVIILSSARKTSETFCP